MKQIALVFIVCSFALQIATAQDRAAKPSKNKYTLSGYVKEKGSGELLVGTSVYITNLKIGTTTNNYGFYSITLDQDSIDVMISYVGYQARLFTIDLKENIRLDVEISANNDLEEVNIIGEREKKISESSRMSVIEIPIEQIKDIPALLGEKDVLKVIQLMPGVQSGSEGNSGLYVRGGGPDQNLIILDDATVYNAYHLFGFFSLFNGDALKSIELTKGGFPARYGGRLSSVLEMNMKEGNKEEIEGEVGIGLLSSKFTLEGPLKKEKSSFLISGRRTYLDILAKPFMPEGESVDYFFYDFNAKVNYDFGDKNKVYLSGYFGRDKASSDFDEGDEEFTLFWGNVTGSARWNHLFNDKLFANTSFTISDYKFSTTNSSNFDGEKYELEYASGIRDYALKLDLDFRPSPKHYIRAGFLSTYHLFTPSAVVLVDDAIGEFENEVTTLRAVESGIYIEDDYSINNRLKINAGIRISHFVNEGKQYIRPEPRFSGRYMIAEDLSVKASFASMNQYIHLLTQSGIGLPTDLWVPATKNIAPQTSNQIAAGIAKDFSDPNFTISIEGYYKKMDHIISYKEGASFLLLSGETTTDDIDWERNITTGQGWSYGAEFLIQKKVGKFSGWIGYTLSFTQFQFDSLNFGNRFWARYDRRHDISVVAIYKLKENTEKKKKVTLSGTWVYGTGNALTLPRAQYISSPHASGETPQGFNQSINDYGNRNDFRMAPYHRLDFGVQFHKEVKRGSRTWEISFYNVYNRQNPFFYFDNVKENGDRVLSQVTLFPIIPSVSYSFKF